MSDSVGGSGADFDVSTKSGGTGSGVSSLSSTKSSSSDISQPRSSDVSCKETTNSNPSLDSTHKEKNLSFCQQDPISNGEPISNADSSKLFEVFEPSMIADETTSSSGPISDTTASSSDSAGPEGSKVAHEESVDSEEDSSSEDGDQGSAPTLRRSSRSTRGAPPKRFGFAFTHHLLALPRLNIPDFEFNL